MCMCSYMCVHMHTCACVPQVIHCRLGKDRTFSIDTVILHFSLLNDYFPKVRPKLLSDDE